MTGSYEAPRGDYPNHLSPGDPNLNIHGGNAQTGLAERFYREYVELCKEIGPLPAASPCATECWVGKNPFQDYDNVELPISVYEDRLSEAVYRYRVARAGLCGGMVLPQAELVRHIDPPPETQFTRFEKIVQKMRPMLQKIGLLAEPTMEPSQEPRPKLVILQPKPHCGQDAKRYQQRLT